MYALWASRMCGDADLQYIVSLDADDDSYDCVKWPTDSVVVRGVSRGSVDAYNRGIYQATGDVVCQAMDDLEPPLHWDRLILNRLGDLSEPKILKVDDGMHNINLGKPWLPTVLIGTMAYFKDCGYMYHPYYVHCFGDDDHGLKALIEGKMVWADGIAFKHIWRGAQADETARREYGHSQEETLSKLRYGREALVRRMEERFASRPELWGHDPERFRDKPWACG